MSIRRIEVGCDTTGCGAYFSTDKPNLDDARAYAANRWGWTVRQGKDVCAPCTRGDTPLARGEA